MEVIKNKEDAIILFNIFNVKIKEIEKIIEKEKEKHKKEYLKSFKKDKGASCVAKFENEQSKLEQKKENYNFIIQEINEILEMFDRLEKIATNYENDFNGRSVEAINISNTISELSKKIVERVEKDSFL